MTKPRIGLICSVCILSVLCGIPAGGGDFTLHVNDVSGLDEPWPLVGGLPFPEGELRDASQIRIVDAAGAEVPAQIDVAATWRDGSLRWALAGFTANPRGDYRVEFGPGVSRSRPATSLRMDQDATGKLTVDTGAAVYEFLADGLLPDSGRMGETVFLVDSGDGTYLVDNQGRLSRVTGARADIETEIVKQGPCRAVIRRTGWYVTGDGERVARAKVWFYFAAGVPVLRVTHSLVFTEDTNELWVRDYGLEFRTPDAPARAVFALGGREQESLYSRQPVDVNERFEAPVGGDELYMVQDIYPHFLERESRAVVGRVPGGRGGDGMLAESFWVQDWLRLAPAVGDWADGAWEGYGLTVVMPWMAHQFPKEIAFGPDGARLALWSGRSGRELDFRAATLVNEYWRSWSRRASGGADALAARPSNAQCAASTHDVWLLPRRGADDIQAVEARARAASHAPLLQSDPAWLTLTEAVGWPMHPKDEARFPEEESVLSRFWEKLMDERYEGLRRTGVIAWGAPPRIRGAGSRFFRESALVDYGLRRHVWGLYARGGERTYLEYATRFNRFAGDWSLAHWDAGKKFKGGFTNDRDFWNAPIYWGSFTQLEPVGGNTGHDIVNWMLEYYLTGDEYAMELVRMHADAYKEHWEETKRGWSRYDGIYMILRVMANLYAVEWDEDIGEMARELARYVIDLERPNAIRDEIRFGSLYKEDRNMISLYYYYRETGDELARQALLKGIDHTYRFNRVGGAFGGQSYPSFLFAVAHHWTGNPDYLRVVDTLVDQHRRWSGGVQITSQINPTMGVPVALGVLAGNDPPADAFPILRLYADPEPSRILFRKAAGRPVTMRLHVRMSNDVDEDTETVAFLAPLLVNGNSGAPERLPLNVEQMMRTEKSSRSDPRRRHVVLAVPANKPAGIYSLTFPDMDYADVLDTDASEISASAPTGFRMQGARCTEYFVVPEGLESLELFLGVPTKVRRSDGSVALEPEPDNLGDQTIPVNGQNGVWSLNPTQSGIVRLINAEPLFTRSPQRRVTGADVAPEPRFEPPSEAMAFVPGRTGQALHLPDGRTLRFARGSETEEGYAHFPGRQGTVEFWFRPNWASVDLAYDAGISFTDRYFLRAGSHDLQYRRGRARRLEMASLNLWAHGTDSNAGFTGRFWFEAGEWYHVAFVWRTQDGLPGDRGHYAVYVNGAPVPDDELDRPANATAKFWPGRAGGGDVFHRREANAAISIGPLDGSIAQVRISDTIRYNQPFEPPDQFADADEHTLALFPLDGTFDGIFHGGTKLTLEP